VGNFPDKFGTINFDFFGKIELERTGANNP